MNCSTGTCTRTAQVREPLPLCETCALHVIVNYAAANLAGSEPVVRKHDLQERKQVRAYQEAVAVALFLNLNRRPEWTEINGALVDAGLDSVSRPTAQRIRERVEKSHPDLPR